MQPRHQTIIDAVIQKARTLCPDSLALIGVYGSEATGDLHAKSDLDLLILIHDEKGRVLSDAFLLDDVGIGYDLYCTGWDGLESDALCHHAHLSKLMDAQIVYVQDPSALDRLDALRAEVAKRLQSDERFVAAKAAFLRAKECYADCMLADELSSVRKHAGAAIYELQSCVMLHGGRYFQKGCKRTFEEIRLLSLPFDMEALVLAVIDAQTADTVQSALTALLRAVQGLISGYGQMEKAAPCGENLRGTYEEMFSNWRNKMPEAAARGDRYASFMQMLSCQHMLDEIAQEVAIEAPDLMGAFDPQDLVHNAAAFDQALAQYLHTYEAAGIAPRRFPDIDGFLDAYLPKDKML